MDEDLAIRDGEDHAFYAQFNTVDALKNVVLLYENKIPIGCGALKKYDTESAEIKRMFILPEYRGKGYASKILHELEKWAIDIQFKKCILETGIKQPEAISLYVKNGYRKIQNYGPYRNVEDSKCFEKHLLSL